MASKECSRTSIHALKANLKREHRDEGSKAMLSKLEVLELAIGADLSSVQLPPIIKVEMPEIPTFLFPIGIFPGDKPVLFFVLEYTVVPY